MGFLYQDSRINCFPHHSKVFYVMFQVVQVQIHSSLRDSVQGLADFEYCFKIKVYLS